MYFSHIQLRRSGVGVARLLQAMDVDDYRHHQFVWQMFGGTEKRDFIYRREDNDNWPSYFVVSVREPLDREEIWKIETKSYAPKLSNGMGLAFSLRVNPVVTRKDEAGKRKRHDVVMDQKKRIGFKKMSMSERPALPAIMREAGLVWLSGRAEKNGFSFERGLVQIDSYSQHLSVKRGGAKPIRFSTLDISGVLTVTESSLFQRALFNGIGPAKGLGCGLLMVRRIS
ncbi:MAG: type I-E CRISPR-associated protein Cas6/Cse3/CasE [Candidatus Thiodiazotropha sp. (ex Rostrolucina anterorostrata)]|nr:type I-E CRISPR-associated protein Cas6/Cse3/CasE [Candidatus Thiodiazotropha sp. (ex Rostrolucina anterorostrata)]